MKNTIRDEINGKIEKNWGFLISVKTLKKKQKHQHKMGRTNLN